MSEAFETGKAKIEEVALRYAGDHGLQLSVEWDDQGYHWLLKLSDAEHSVNLVFSPDEIEFFAEDLPENQATKKKISNAFASLSM